MICWSLMGILIAYILSIVFADKTYSIVLFIFLFLEKILKFMVSVLKIIKSVTFNLGLIIKFLAIIFLSFTFLVFFTSIAKFLIIIFLNFIIGLKEAFSNASREGRLYLLSLYIILFYIFINKREVSIRIEKHFSEFCNKYFSSRDREGFEKYKNVLLLLLIYFLICLVGIKFYQINGNEWSKTNRGDIINIFIWATYMITPIVAIWVFSDWRNQKKYEINKDTSLNLLKVILDIENCLEELMAVTNEFRCLKDNDEHNFFGKKCDELILKYYNLLNELKSNNNLHHGLVRGFKEDKIVSIEMLKNVDSFFQSLCNMILEINDNYASNIKSKNIADKLLKNIIKAVNENKISYRDSFSPIKELLSEECQPHKKAP